MAYESYAQLLLTLARDTIDYGSKHQELMPLSIDKTPEILLQKRASFVTINKQGELRGCMGNLTPTGPLINSIHQNSYNAAFRDPRFVPVTQEELTTLQLHISVLSEPQLFSVKDEADLIAQLKVGEDGLILQEGAHSATFLPSVWEQLPDAKTFVTHLKNKAGWSKDYWTEGIQCFRYHTESIEE